MYLISLEAGVLLTALLSYSTGVKGFSSHKRKAADLGTQGFLFVWGVWFLFL